MCNIIITLKMIVFVKVEFLEFLNPINIHKAIIVFGGIFGLTRYKLIQDAITVTIKYNARVQ